VFDLQEAGVAMGEDKGLKQRVSKQSEDAIGKLTQGVLENPVLTGAVAAAFEARGRALRAQEAAMGALNLPSASDLERLTRRLRSVSQRLEAIEESLDRVHDRVQSLDTPEQLEQRLEAIEAALARIEAAVTAPKED
jgi:chromosome segregation ATPase